MALANLQHWLKRGTRNPLAHRQLLIINGDSRWVEEHTTAAINSLDNCPSIGWLGTVYAQIAVAANRPLTLYKQLLGQEFDIAIYNAYDGLRPNALLALAGTVKAGGTLIVLSPLRNDWPRHASVCQPHFLSYGWQLSHSEFTARLVSLWSSNEHVAWYSPTVTTLPEATGIASAPTSDSRFKTIEQQQVYQQVIKQIATGPSLAVITAARGRGKSSLLALLAAHWQAQGKSVWLTSPVQQTQQVFYSVLSHHYNSDNTCPVVLPEVVWKATDNPDLVQRPPDILLIDEAAALPLPVLEKLVEHNPSCVLSTTTMGFEGSGLGFEQRFLTPRLTAGTAQLYTLPTPLRWLDNDPLEMILNASLLNLRPAKASNEIANSLVFSQVKQLDENHRHALFTLLSQAHYQTTPDDYMRLLDAPEGMVALLFRDNNLVAAAAINNEGGAQLSPLAEQIASGARRVSGHLSAQSIASFSACPYAATQRYWRISRIAVDNTYRRKGFASKLLLGIKQRASSWGVDWLSTSFGYTNELMQFWHNNDFVQIKLGNKADKASGKVSAQAVFAISGTAKGLLPTYQMLYTIDSSYPAAFPPPLSALDSAVKQSLWHRIRAYLHEHRSRQLVGGALAVAISAIPSEKLLHLPITTALYAGQAHQPRLNENILIRQFNFTGKQALETALLKELQSIFSLLEAALVA